MEVAGSHEGMCRGSLADANVSTGGHGRGSEAAEMQSQVARRFQLPSELVAGLQI